MSNLVSTNAHALQGRALSATASTSYRYDSNVYRTNTNQVSDSIMLFTPKILMDIKPRKQYLKTSYTGQLARHVVRKNEDYFNHDLTAQYNIRPTSDWTFDSAGSYKRSRIERGETGVVATPFEPPSLSSSSTGSFGVKHYSKFIASEIQAKYSRGMVRYDNTDQHEQNNNRTNYQLRNTHELTGKTRTYFYVDRGETNYINQSNSVSNSTSTNYVLGAEWVSSGKTVSYIELGWQDLEYTSFPTQGYQGIYFDADIVWKRKSYSTVTLTASRSTREFLDSDSLHYVSNSVNISLENKFIARWGLNLVTGVVFNQSQNNNADFMFSFRPSVSYAMARWINLRMGMAIQRKSSTIDANNFNVFTLDSTIELYLD